MRRLLARAMVVLIAVAGITWATAASTTTARAAVACTGISAYYDYYGQQAWVPTYGQNTHYDNCDLWQGTTGNGVLGLQITLDQCYGLGIAEDGIYGPQTAAAVWYAQWYSGDPVRDGIYGPQTEYYLSWWAVGTYFCAPLYEPKIPIAIAANG